MKLDIEYVMKEHTPTEEQFRNVASLAEALKSEYFSSDHPQPVRARFLRDDFWMATAMHWAAHAEVPKLSSEIQ